MKLIAAINAAKEAIMNVIKVRARTYHRIQYHLLQHLMLSLIVHWSTIGSTRSARRQERNISFPTETRDIYFPWYFSDNGLFSS